MCVSVQLFTLPWTTVHGLLCPWNSPGKNTGVGCHSFLQGILLIQGSNSGLLYCRQIFLPSEPQGKPFRFNMIPFKLPMTVFTELEQTILKFIWKHKKPELPTQCWKRKKKNKRHNPPRLQTILQSYHNQNSGARTDIWINETE